MRTTITSLLLAGAVLALGSYDASAQSRRTRVYAEPVDGYIEQLPLTVNRRSFLDPGPVAPVGTGRNYMAASTIFNKTPDHSFAPDKFGNDTLPGQPYVPGRSVAVYEFSTGPLAGDN